MLYPHLIFLRARHLSPSVARGDSGPGPGRQGTLGTGEDLGWERKAGREGVMRNGDDSWPRGEDLVKNVGKGAGSRGRGTPVPSTWRDLWEAEVGGSWLQAGAMGGDTCLDP